MTSNSLHSIEKLDSNNYHSWKFKVRMVLIDKELWGVVCGDEPKPTDPDDLAEWRIKDQKALATIALTVKDSEHIHISNSATSGEAWEALAKLYEGKGVSRRLNLRRKL